MLNNKLILLNNIRRITELWIFFMLLSKGIVFKIEIDAIY